MKPLFYCTPGIYTPKNHIVCSNCFKEYMDKRPVKIERIQTEEEKKPGCTDEDCTNHKFT